MNLTITLLFIGELPGELHSKVYTPQGESCYSACYAITSKAEFCTVYFSLATKRS